MRALLGAFAALGAANFEEAWRALLVSRQRSLLALIGIVIGVASVSAMVSVGAVVRAEALAQFEELGTDLVKVRLRPRTAGRGPRGVSLADAEAMVSTGAVRVVAPYITDNANVLLAGVRPFRAELVGATAALADLNRLRIAEGRFVTRLDAPSHYCVVGAEIASALESATGGSALGALVRIAGIGHEIVGVLEPTPEAERVFEPNRAVILALPGAQRLAGGKPLRDALARLTRGVHYREAGAALSAYFAGVAPAFKVAVRSPEALIEHMQAQMRLYTLLLGTVGGIALLVGGIGVMNVMLVAVAERRAEIGLRRALGARRADVGAQFLAESLVLSLTGGLLGVFLAVGLTWGICTLLGWSFAVSELGFMLGTAVSAGAGVAFGLYPAFQAARLDPVAALQGR